MEVYAARGPLERAVAVFAQEREVMLIELAIILAVCFVGYMVSGLILIWMNGGEMPWYMGGPPTKRGR